MANSANELKSIREGPFDSLHWQEEGSGLELRAGNAAVARLQRDVIVSGDGNCEFKKVKGWLHPVYSASSSLGSALDSLPAMFRYMGSIWSQFKEKWRLELKNGTFYECRMTGAGKWAAFRKDGNAAVVRYESPVDYLDYFWTPKPEGQIQIAEDFRTQSEMPLIVFWGLYLLSTHRHQQLHYKGTT